jgi:hypothetical protein
MTTTLNIHRFLTAATTASASGSYATDYRFPTAVNRSIFGKLTGGARADLYVCANPLDLTVEVLASSFTTSSFSTIIEGPIAMIRVEKVGTTGTAWVEGLV